MNGGCMTAFWMWLPVLIGKLLKGVWTLCLFLLQFVCGMPLYCCSRTVHRILGQLIGFFGLLLFGSGALSLILLIFDREYARSSVFLSAGDILASALVSLVVGAAALFACRAVIRHGVI